MNNEWIRRIINDREKRHSQNAIYTPGCYFRKYYFHEKKQITFLIQTENKKSLGIEIRKKLFSQVALI